MKIRLSFIAMLALVAVCIPFASRSEQRNSTLLIVPREDAPVKVGLDVGNRFPTILISYKIDPNGSASLHGWSGQEWVNITSESYQDGTFFKSGPASALIVFEEGQDFPEILIPNDTWCPSVFSISTTNIRPLIHLFGRHYDFKYDDWKWFSDNYRLPLNRINPDGLNISWYHERLADRLNSGNENDLSDLRYLQIIRSPEIDTVAEVDMHEEMDAHPSEDSPEETSAESDDGMDDNPLTNDVPQAVVLGDATETESMGPQSVEDDTGGEAPPEE